MIFQVLADCLRCTNAYTHALLLTFDHVRGGISLILSILNSFVLLEVIWNCFWFLCKSFLIPAVRSWLITFVVHENEQACIIVCLGAYMRSVFVVDKYIGCISIVGSGLEFLLISVSLLFDPGS